jgi:hypothetical protein
MPIRLVPHRVEYRGFFKDFGAHITWKFQRQGSTPLDRAGKATAAKRNKIKIKHPNRAGFSKE